MFFIQHHVCLECLAHSWGTRGTVWGCDWRGREGGKIVGGRLRLLKMALSSGLKKDLHGHLSRLSLSSQPRSSAASSRKPSWLSSTPGTEQKSSSGDLTFHGSLHSWSAHQEISLE